jgi:nucleoside-diphosphate-sugar epimerase
MKSMKSKKVVVIGGSSGIGLATAKGAVALGAEVIIAARTPERLERARQEIGHSVETARLDMSQEEQVRSFFDVPWLPDLLTRWRDLASLGKTPAEDVRIHAPPADQSPRTHRWQLAKVAERRCFP